MLNTKNISILSKIIEKNSIGTERTKLKEALIEFMPDKIYDDISNKEYALKDFL